MCENNPIEPEVEVKKEKRIVTIIKKIQEFPNKYRSVTIGFVVGVCVFLSFVSMVMFNSRYTEYMVINDTEQAEVAREELKTVDVVAEAEKRLELMKQQIIVTKNDGLTVVYNAADETIINYHQESLCNWAKEKEYDSIIIGRIQEPMDGGEMEFSTYDGKNRVPLKFVVERLEEMGCNKTVSFMFNMSNFTMPHPIVDQTYGKLRIYPSEGLKVAGFALTADKLRITSSNFDGEIKNGVIEGNFETPWDIKK